MLEPSKVTDQVTFGLFVLILIDVAQQRHNHVFIDCRNGLQDDQTNCSLFLSGDGPRVFGGMGGGIDSDEDESGSLSSGDSEIGVDDDDELLDDDEIGDDNDNGAEGSQGSLNDSDNDF